MTSMPATKHNRNTHDHLRAYAVLDGAGSGTIGTPAYVGTGGNCTAIRIPLIEGEVLITDAADAHAPWSGADEVRVDIYDLDGEAVREDVFTNDPAAILAHLDDVLDARLGLGKELHDVDDAERGVDDLAAAGGRQSDYGFREKCRCGAPIIRLHFDTSSATPYTIAKNVDGSLHSCARKAN